MINAIIEFSARNRFVVFLLVLREDARAERIAMHSFNLELLSRDLLDANVRHEERAQPARADGQWVGPQKRRARSPGRHAGGS